MSSIRFTRKQGKIIVLENEPFELQCSVTGAPIEIQGKKIKWKGPDPIKTGEIDITGNDANGNITTETSESYYSIAKTFLNNLKLNN